MNFHFQAKDIVLLNRVIFNTKNETGIKMRNIQKGKRFKINLSTTNKSQIIKKCDKFSHLDQTAHFR